MTTARSSQKSRLISDHDDGVRGEVCSGAEQFCRITAWHRVQDFICLSMMLPVPGNHTFSLNKAFILIIPWGPS